ncbi:unnamed protein product [Clonostachys rosea]|uniref:Protein ecm33 n=1 Tax=Bionectria ochroleuca TaxID=29856 RepID=A0ABY6TZX7_BIOOC|nr:unnamed protein product [Clonostachys rosea]
MRLSFVLGALLAASAYADSKTKSDSQSKNKTIDCSANVTVSGTDDAKLASSCSTIGGSLIFSKMLNTTVSLDNVTSIKGGVEFNPCKYSKSETELAACPKAPSFNISMPKLQTIDGQILVNYANGLKSLDLPELISVGEVFRLNYTVSLTSLNVTKLEYVGALSITSPVLEDFDIKRLKGFTKNYANGGWINVGDVGKVSNLDGILAYPLEAAVAKTDPAYNLTLNIKNIPFVRQLNIGWNRIDTLDVGGINMAITLGATEKTSVEISNFTVRTGVKSLHRRDLNTNLTVKSVTIKGGNDFESLNLPFTSLANLDIQYSKHLESIQLPTEAANWLGASFTIKDSPNLILDQVNKADSKVTWYWPRKMKALTIYGNITTAFFEKFVTDNVQVTDTFDIKDNSNSLRCYIFDAMPHGSLPANRKCSPISVESPQPVDDLGIPSIGMNWALHLSLLVATILVLL